MWIKYMVEGITFIFSVASTRTLSLCISKFWIWRDWVQFLSHLLLKFMPSHLWSILFVLHVVRLVFECIWLFVFRHYRFASWPRYTILTLIRQGSSSSPSLFPTLNLKFMKSLNIKLISSCSLEGYASIFSKTSGVRPSKSERCCWGDIFVLPYKSKIWLFLLPNWFGNSKSCHMNVRNWWLVMIYNNTWRVLTIIHYFLPSIQALLSAPNPDDPLSENIAKHWKSNEAEAVETGNVAHVPLIWYCC